AVVGIGVGASAAFGRVPLIAGPFGFFVFLAVIAIVIFLALGFAWADRTLVLLNLGAVDSLPSNWWLFWHHKLDTFVVALAMGLVVLGIGIGVFLAAVVLAVPGGLLIFAGVTVGASALAVAGVLLLVLL